MLLQDIEADGSIRVNVWMIDPRGEVDLGWFEWVVSWEVNVQEEYATVVWGLIRAHDCCLPMILVLFIDWTGRAVGRWILTKIN